MTATNATPATLDSEETAALADVLEALTDETADLTFESELLTEAEAIRLAQFLQTPHASTLTRACQDCGKEIKFVPGERECPECLVAPSTVVFTDDESVAA